MALAKAKEHESGSKDQAPAPAGAFAETDLHRYLRILSERRWAFILVVVTGIAWFALWASRQVKIYQAKATIVVERQPPQVFGAEVRDVTPMGPAQNYYMGDYMQTQRRVLTSDSLMREVITRLRLLDDTAFWGADRPASLQAAAERFGGLVRADIVFDTQIISVSFDHVDPNQAKRAVDGVVDTYIDRNLELRDTSNESAAQWLADQTDDLRQRLTASEMSLYDFKHKNDLLSVSLEDRMNNTSRQIERLSDALTEAKLHRVERVAEADALRKMVEDGPVSATTSSGDSVGELKGLAHEEDRRLSELRARYQDAHPLVRQQMAKVDAAHAALKRESELQIRTAGVRTDEMIEQEKKIAAELESARQEGLRITRLEVEYNKIKREADAISKQYVMVQNRTKETELASKVKLNNLHVLDYARVPGSPISPQLGRAGAVALFASLLAGLFLAFALDALDRSVKTQDDVETRLGLPFLGIIPSLEDGQGDRIVAEKPHSPPAECCRLIRTNLTFAGLERPLRRVLITSPIAREGKTMTSVSLGTVLAQAGQKVLLVDCDLRRPRLRSALGIESDIGVTNVLIGALPLDEAIIPTNIPNLSILCSGPIPPNPAELVEGQHFRTLLERCSDRFERVLVDSPPAVPVTDPGILARYCDGVVVVLRSRKTHFDQALRASRNLLDVGARIVGVVLNDYPIWNRHYAGYLYGYGDPYASRKQSQPQRKAS
jgi:capsular exopolysaccharide synthesis family protein